MQHKTKIIVSIIIGVIILVPIILVVAAILSVSAMQSTSETGAMPPMETRMMLDDSIISQASSFELTAGSTAAEVDQKIIKTGYLDITVDAVDESVAKITALAGGVGGYIQDSSVYEREDGTKYGTVTTRVPAKEFENTLLEIKKLAAAVNTETSSGQDVTEEYTDLAAQLRNAKAQETEYLEILKKAETVTDILAVQSYLGQVRSEIEMFQGRIKYLENMTGYSTITTSLSEEPTLKIPSKEFRPWSTIKEAGQALVALFQNLIVTAIWFIILGGGLLLPIVILALVVYLIVKKMIRKKMMTKR